VSYLYSNFNTILNEFTKNEIGIDKGIKNLISTSSGNIYGKNIFDKIFEKLEKQFTKDKNRQRIFQYIDNCKVPENGEDGGWDVIYEDKDGITLPEGTTVHKIYVEMKNKHNTMNSSSASKTFIKMQNQLLNDDDCACFLVEAIAQHSQNIKWETTVDKQKVSHKLIRRVSMDQFWSLVTGEEDAFYKICMLLPEVIKEVIQDTKVFSFPDDNVCEEIEEKSKLYPKLSNDEAIAMAFYMLAFSEYLGFKK